MIRKTYVGEAGLQRFFTEELSVIIARMVSAMQYITPAALRIAWWKNGEEQPRTVLNVEFQDDSTDGKYGTFIRRQWAKLKIDERIAFELSPLPDVPGTTCLALAAQDGEYLIACSLENDAAVERNIEREVAAAIAVMHEVIDPSMVQNFTRELKLSPRRLKRVEKWLLSSKDKAAREWRG